ncbi:hypothetical protein PPROV_000205300 [Pycnococcus provasolii]|uniref:50S ribosomal protein L31 n=1 Tax=Pycnococcus provasolii TaxID=41880 RepID=A0A830H9C5_9CHLO|nr:hypothetical protein PPROV_000205300 [Pycnococcus provasolii]
MSSSSALRGRSLSSRAARVPCGLPRPSCRAIRAVSMKPDIHPEFHESAKVYCNGELVLELGGTKEEYVVDVWSGNHPFYTGGDSNLVLDEGRVSRFANRYGGLESMSAGVKTLKDDVDAPKATGPKVARGGKKKKGKK